MEQLKARAERLIGIEGSTNRVLSATQELLNLTKPKPWNTNVINNAEVEIEREYQRTLLVLEQHTTQDLDRISIHKFYSLIAFVKEKTKKDGNK